MTFTVLLLSLILAGCASHQVFDPLIDVPPFPGGATEWWERTSGGHLMFCRGKIGLGYVCDGLREAK